MRDAGKSWNEIAKVHHTVKEDATLAHNYQAFPTRTEGSVKKHWYKVR